jgi:hypothetical protein
LRYLKSNTEKQVKQIWKMFVLLKKKHFYLVWWNRQLWFHC